MNDTREQTTKRTPPPIITAEDMKKIMSMIDARLDRREPSAPRANAAMAALVALHTGLTAGEVCALDERDFTSYINARYGLLRVGATMRDAGPRHPRECATEAQYRDLFLHTATIRRIREFEARNYGTRGDPRPIIASYVRPRKYPRAIPQIAWTRPAKVCGMFRTMCEGEGLGRPYTFGSLRRTHAAMLLRAGVPAEVMAARLGRADAARLARDYDAECAEGEAHRSEWAARVEDVRRDAWGSKDPEGRAAAAIIHDALAALAG